MTLFAKTHSRFGGWVIALGFVLCWYALLQGTSHWLLQVSPNLPAVPRDLLANLLLGAILYSVTRSLSWYLPAVGLLMAALHLSNSGKIAVLGGPIMPDDFLVVRNLFLLLDGWQLAGVIAVVALPCMFLIIMTAWRSLRTWGVFAGLGLIAAGIVLAPVSLVHSMDRLFGNIVWDQRGNFENRGLLIHLVQETARQVGRGGNPPPEEAVAEALQYLRSAGGSRHHNSPFWNADPSPAAVLRNGLHTTGMRPFSRLSGPAPRCPETGNHCGASPKEGIGDGVAASARAGRRNVHMIVLESFWDPVRLKASGLSEDPIDPAFRDLWRATGHSHALSPVFGGYTANAEFEVLCGFPVTEDAVFFEGWLSRDVPCLPEHLSRAGYTSIASHPNIATFWNRVNAYQRIGFDHYWSDRDFVLDDMNREFLSDASLYRQVMGKVRPLTEAGTPVFNYILTFFGHLDYPLNDRRPALVRANDDNRLIAAYANTMYYKSRELMAFLDRLRETDPESLIVLFGDHLPFLGPNFAGFTESGLLEDNRSKFNARMLDTLVATPLVVIDGRRGPLQLGEIPMYRLPGLILELLGDQTPSIMRLTTNPAGTIIRPLPGMHLVNSGEELLACRADDRDDDACRISGHWLDAVNTLTRDLFGGEQYVLAVPSNRGLVAGRESIELKTHSIH